MRSDHVLGPAASCVLHCVVWPVDDSRGIGLSAHYTPRMSKRIVVGICCGAALVLSLAGCSLPGEPVAQSNSGATDITTSTADSATAQPTGPSVGTATMKVVGGPTPVTIRYRINGGPETRTESAVTLPWSKDYPVYNEVSSSVSVTGGTEVDCAIMMGSSLVSYKTEPNPTCEFAYYG